MDKVILEVHEATCPRGHHLTTKYRLGPEMKEKKDNPDLDDGCHEVTIRGCRACWELL